MREKKTSSFSPKFNFKHPRSFEGKKINLPSSQVARFFYVSKMSLEYIDLRKGKWKEKNTPEK